MYREIIAKFKKNYDLGLIYYTSNLVNTPSNYTVPQKARRIHFKH